MNNPHLVYIMCNFVHILHSKFGRIFYTVHSFTTMHTEALLANPFLNYNLIADCSNGKEPKNDAKESEAQDAKQIDMA